MERTMNVRDLIPWRRPANTQAPAVYRDETANPFLTLHREMNRLFDETLRQFDMPSLFGRMPSWPSIEVSETDTELRVTAEVPGLDEKDIEVLLSNGLLTIRGEKKESVEDKQRQFSERYYGRFERQIALGTEVEEDRIKASFKNGLLSVILPKTAKAQASRRRIPINGTN
jgi:HSP20 family protein